MREGYASLTCTSKKESSRLSSLELMSVLVEVILDEVYSLEFASAEQS